MKNLMIRAVATLSAGCLLQGAIPATAQYRHYDDHGGHGDWHHNPDNGHHGNGHHGNGHYDNGHHDNGGHRWHSYGGQYGYNGYHGRWRTGQHYSHYNDAHYVIQDYRTYNLPPPRPGYRYYHDDNGDVVMAAIAGGTIGLILGSALSSDNH